MAGILLGTERQKTRLETDTGVVTTVVVAQACAGVTIVLLFMRRQKLDPIRWGLVAVNVAIIFVVGIAEIALLLCVDWSRTTDDPMVLL